MLSNATTGCRSLTALSTSGERIMTSAACDSYAGYKLKTTSTINRGSVKPTFDDVSDAVKDEF